MTADRTVSLAEAKSKLSELVAAAEAGETIVITKRGRPVVELHAPSETRLKVELELLHKATQGMSEQSENAGDVVRRLRDDARY